MTFAGSSALVLDDEPGLITTNDAAIATTLSASKNNNNDFTIFAEDLHSSTAKSIIYNGQSIFQCPECSLSFTGKAKAKLVCEHALSHGISALEFICGSCGTYQNKSVKSVANHYRTCSKKKQATIPETSDSSSRQTSSDQPVHHATPHPTSDIHDDAEKPLTAPPKPIHMSIHYPGRVNPHTTCPGCSSIFAGKDRANRFSEHSKEQHPNYVFHYICESCLEFSHKNLMPVSVHYAKCKQRNTAGQSLTDSAQAASGQSGANTELDPELPFLFSPAQAIQILEETLNRKRLHPRYRQFLTNEMHEIAALPVGFSRAYLNDFSIRYHQYLRSPRKTTTNATLNYSTARKLGVVPIRLSKGNDQLFRTISLLAMKNPQNYRKVIRSVTSEIEMNSDKYRKLAMDSSCCHLSYEEALNSIKRGNGTASDLILHAAAAHFQSIIRLIDDHGSNGQRIIFHPFSKHNRASNTFWILKTEDGQFLPCRPYNGGTKRQNKKLEIQRLRSLYFRDTKQLANLIINEEAVIRCPIESLPLKEHFEHVFASNAAVKQLPPCEPYSRNTDNLSPWPPLEPSDFIDAAKGLSSSSTPGPDQVTLRDIRGFDPDFIGITLLANIALSLGSVPNMWRNSSTILLAKNGKLDPKSPSFHSDRHNIQNWRPISISSILLRIFHRTLLPILRTHVTLTSKQNAFTSNGCLKNILLMSDTIRRCRDKKQELAVGFLDIASAFDTLSHSAIDQELASHQCPRFLRNYIANVYADASTTLSIPRRDPIGPIPIRRGVRQGDPLSPFLFAVSIDRALSDVSTSQSVHLAYADDVAIISNSTHSLSSSILHLDHKLADLGLSISKNKTAIYHQKYVEGRLTVGEGLQDFPYAAITLNDPLRFLGHTPFKKTDFRTISEQVLSKINLVDAAPLSPTQKTHLLNDYILPSFISSLAGATELTPSILADIDQLIRANIKRILRIPLNSNEGFIYLPNSKGGLGIRSVAYEALNLRLSAIDDLLSEHTEVQQSNRLQSWRDEALKHINPEYNAAEKRSVNYHNRLIAAWRGAPTQATGLDSFVNGQAHRSILRFRYFQSRHAVFVRSVLLRLELLPTNAVLHALNDCEYSTSAMINRHDAVQKRLIWALNNTSRNPHVRGATIHTENRIATNDGRILKPDIIIHAPASKKIYVLDVGIYYESTPNKAESLAHHKTTKYEPLRPVLAKKFGVPGTEITMMGIPVGSRGTVSNTLSENLSRLGLSSKTKWTLAKTAEANSQSVFAFFTGASYHGRKFKNVFQIYER